ncbi:MAG: 3-methyl-2-oxobutanoate hydroxymethyltransferase [Chroococcopsis gigantea SAG 12.99]|jgi:3-methyl-2-oxobutanoate hydroxymethyltransferase|nr:3-methyl-2-oxobutanoate hydroxymethyltransferase [Chlorogloea purpurea SAG 13.99]MDV2999358.1 3-methyl-2-oxobutanoate hydroxymethyltransferase [Chroococcopsis gigantea SAG 12.99]
MAVSIGQLGKWKEQRRPIVALTAWDYAISSILDAAGIDIILVGDSLAMVALGYPNTLPITLDAMIHHASAVSRGVKQALMVCDLPFLTYQESLSQAIHSAGRILKEAGVQGVKLEGGYPLIVETISHLTTIGIPVMGHIGLTPQSVHRLGYRQQGKSPEEANRLIREALQLEGAGVFALVLEHIPSDLAEEITSKLSIPTIGIGAGPFCDGQVLVTADLLGLTPKQPPFATPYANLRDTITLAVNDFAGDVREGKFNPDKT